ncbi:MAG: DUF1361 domain-containing protein [Leptolyngbyaceae cyanobacterium RU_5_1]|nr:DUF1361 domain-containing protein [Leptolyngbyaceae cyanobacterium RU_5_1]
MLDVASEVFTRHGSWILWNLFLAFIPLALSFWLYRRRTNARSLLWWVGFIVFIAFLPNAPYLLTDIIHLIRATRSGYSAWVITLLVMPLHLFAILAGFEAYVVSVMNQSHYLQRQGAARYVVWSELLTHALCAIGVYLGRFRRYNSWDLVSDPGYILVSTIDDLTSKRPLVVIIICFVSITVLYWIVKQVNLGLLLRFREVRSKQERVE